MFAALALGPLGASADDHDGGPIVIAQSGGKSLSEAVEVAGRIGAKDTWFTHCCHDLGHAATCASLPERVALAYDGLRIACR